MGVRYISDRKGIGEASEVAMNDELADQVAAAIMAKAESIASSEGLGGYASSLRVESGVRPKGRGYVRVIADHDDAAAHEHGDTNKARLRILGRAAGVEIFPAGS